VYLLTPVTHHTDFPAVLDSEQNVALKDFVLLPAVLRVGALDYTCPRKEEKRKFCKYQTF
jgi:hypothetical protein